MSRDRSNDPRKDRKNERPETPAPHLRPDDPSLLYGGAAMGRSAPQQPTNTPPPAVKTRKHAEREEVIRDQQACRDDLLERQAKEKARLLEDHQKELAALKYDLAALAFMIEKQGQPMQFQQTKMNELKEDIAACQDRYQERVEEQSKEHAGHLTEHEKVQYANRLLEEDKFNQQEGRESVSSTFVRKAHPAAPKYNSLSEELNSHAHDHLGHDDRDFERER